MDSLRRILRDADILDRDAERIPEAQFARLQKVANEPFFLVAHPVSTDSGDLIFAVSGSTQTRHTVELGRDGRITCSCMDARTRCRRCGCICKHACFVLARVIRLSNPASYSNRRLSEADLRTCTAAVSGRAGLQEAVFRPLVFAQRESVLSPATFSQFRRPVSGDECPICYATLMPKTAHNPLRGCPECSQAVHRECMSRWARCASRPEDRSCVMCRSSAWATWDGS